MDPFKRRFDLLVAHIELLYPKIATFPWEKYADRYRQVDPEKGPKYVGLVFELRHPSDPTIHRQVWGEFEGLSETLTVLQGKFDLLTQHPKSHASILHRNRANKLYGGSIRGTALTEYGFSRLPELGDHVLLATLLLFYKLISTTRYEKIMDLSQPWMFEALDGAGMSREQFTALVRDLTLLVVTTIPE